MTARGAGEGDDRESRRPARWRAGATALPDRDRAREGGGRGDGAGIAMSAALIVAVLAGGLFLLALDRHRGGPVVATAVGAAVPAGGAFGRGDD